MGKVFLSWLPELPTLRVLSGAIAFASLFLFVSCARRISTLSGLMVGGLALAIIGLGTAFNHYSVPELLGSVLLE